jgi:uncharacterized protein
MKIGVLSDTHDHLSNILLVLAVCREREIKTLIHCGDLTGLEMVPFFEGFRVIYTPGNMDFATGTIKKWFTKQGEENFVGPVFKGQLNGVLVAATHSHIEGKVMELVRHQRYRWIFHGHTHQRRDEVIRGARIINPGALGGLGKESRSFCIVDLAANDVEFIMV